jgi:hypothetical protein
LNITVSKQQRQLLSAYSKLPEKDRETLLLFAEFMLQQAQSAEQEQSDISPEPVEIRRPEDESVVGALRRLNETYPMLEKSLLLNEASALMTSHVVKGQSAVDVIDELEILFEREYQFFSEQK